MARRFEGNVAVVTGGSSGIGLACVLELIREGAMVVCTGLPADGGHAVSALTDAGLESSALLEVTGDMKDEDFCNSVMEKAVSHFGKVDFLINNAFSFNSAGLDATSTDWSTSLNVGPVAYARMIQLLAKHLIGRGAPGAVVNISSISAHIAQPNRWTYNAAKGAVDQLTKCAALDLAQKAGGIRVNSVSPGWVWTREVAKAAGHDRAKWEPVWGEYHMLGRLCDPVEIARPVLFLLSSDASFITGTDLPVDGGYLGLGPEGLGKTAKFAAHDK